MSQDKISLLRDTTGASSRSDNVTYDSVDNAPPQVQIANASQSRKLPQYVAALAATLSALSAGAVLGWTSPILDEIEKGKFHNITVNENQMGWIGSFVTLGAMTMCIPTGFICDLIGRKKTLLLLIIPFTIGWVLILCASSVLMLYFGRLITGLATGACCVAAPLYCNEIASKEIRGTLGSYFQLMMTIGIFLAYLFGKFLSPINFTIFCSCLPLLFVIVFFFQPETPVYLLKKQMYDAALASLTHLRGTGWNNESELSQIEGSLKESRESSISITETFKRKACRKAFIIALALMFFQQFSGINAVILYTSDIFASSGVKLDPNTAVIIVGAFQAVATFLSSLVIDRLGRRILLFVSSVVMAFSSTALAIFFSLKNRSSIDHETLTEIGAIPVVSLCLFVVVFSLGLGPIPWMISSEIFTPELKSIAGSIAGTFNWFLAFLITKFYLQVNNLIGQDVTFYFFAATSLLGAIFVFVLVPETKGKSIDEIQTELEN